ncbi:MAG TPA: hypothetical protein VK687_14860, partial [Bryobacteraceae bacterium]|nr:hypothetical protein [Bryobacteraceae bacterium]
MKRFTLVLAAAVVLPLCAAAQDSADVLARMKAMEDRIQALEMEIQALKGQPAGAPAVAATPAAPVAAQAPQTALAAQAQAQAGLPQTSVLGGAGGAASKVLNPDIAVIGDFLGAAGNSRGHPTPALEMHESEAAFQAILDPYARADFFLSFGEQGVTLEEGYMTFPALPGG